MSLRKPDPEEIADVVAGCLFFAAMAALAVVLMSI